jgi:hypothetical protein
VVFSTNAQQPSSTASVAPTIATTEQLRLDFINNELAAERHYGSGKLLVVFGEMRSIRTERDGMIIVQFTGVDARLRPSMAAEAATYRQGQQLQLICVLGLRDFWVSLRDCRSPNMHGAPAPAAQPASPPAASGSGVPMIVSAPQYHADYEANPIAADNRYKGRTLTVFGTVRLVGRDIQGRAYESLHADTMDFAAVDAILAPGMLDEAATYRPGQKIQLVRVGGERIGEIGLPALGDCRSP